MKRSVIVMLMCLVMILGVCNGNTRSLNAEELTDQPFFIDMIESDELIVGNEVSVTFQLSNYTEVDLNITSVVTTLAGMDWGTVSVVSSDGDDIGTIGKTIQKGDILQVKVNGTIPKGCSDGDSVQIEVRATGTDGNTYVVVGNSGNVNYVSEEGRLELFLSSDEMVVVGEEVELNLTIVNDTNLRYCVTDFFANDLLQNAKLCDEFGNEVINYDNLIIQSGDVLDMKVRGVISPESSNEFLEVNVGLKNSSNGAMYLQKSDTIWHLSVAYKDTEFNSDIYAYVSPKDILVFGEKATFDIQLANQSNGHILTWDSFKYGDIFEDVKLTNEFGEEIIISDNMGIEFEYNTNFTLECTLKEDAPYYSGLDFEIGISYKNGATYTYKDRMRVYQLNYSQKDWQKDVCDVWLTTRDKVKAGREVTYDVMVMNITDNDITYAGIYPYCTYPLNDGTGRLFSEDLKTTEKDANGNELTKESRIIAPGEIKVFKTTVTIPSYYDDNCSINVEAACEDDPGMYYTSYWWMEGTYVGDPMVTKITKVGAIKPGKQLVYDVDLICEDDFTITDVVCDYYGDWNWYDAYNLPSTKLKSKLVDTNGNEIYANGANVSFKAGDRVQLKYIIDIPTDWDKDSLIDMHIEGIDSEGEKFNHYLWMDLWESEAEADVPMVSMNASDNSLLDAVMNDVEKESNLDAEVKMTAQTKTEANMSENDKKVIKDIKDMGDGKEIAVAVDLNVFKKINGENDDCPQENKVTKLHKKVKITMDIPEEYRESDCEFVVYKEHNGVITELKDLDGNPNTVTFETDEFSLYTIAYSVEEDEEGDIIPSTPSGEADKEPEKEPEDNPNQDKDTQAPANEGSNEATENKINADNQPTTGDSSEVSVIALFMMISVVGLGALKALRKEVN